MFLTKNRLKKIKRVEDDDMLHYLKYSHLEPVKEDNILKVDEATQYPDIRNNFTQTQLIQTSDKEPDTYDDLNKMDRNARYILKADDARGASWRSHDDKSFKNDKQTQVNSYLIREYEPKTAPSSSDEDKEGFVSRNVRRGFRLAEFALNTSIMGANLSMAVGDAIADMITAPHQSSEEEQQNNQEVISVNSSPPETINSSSSPDVVQISSSSSSRHTPTSIPAPTSPQPSSPASSAKTTPRRK